MNLEENPLKTKTPDRKAKIGPEGKLVNVWAVTGLRSFLIGLHHPLTKPSAET